MISADDNRQLTSVGPGTPLGEVLRRYWVPVGLSADVTDHPQLVRIFGEDLVLFRTKQGQAGLMDARCAHRGASLVYGWVEEDGIRCRYHGWRYAANGRCTEIPGETGRAEPGRPAAETRLQQKTYETRELGGLVFAYMGPQPAPALPRLDTLVRTDGVRKATVARMIACNFLQIVENSMDPMHLPFVHGESIKVWAALPQFEIEDTPWGLKQIQYRPGPTPAERYVRALVYFLPFNRMVGIPAPEDDFSTATTTRTIWAVPVDDTHTIEFEVRFQPSKGDRPVDFRFESTPADFELELEQPFQQYRVPAAGRVSYPKFFGAQDQLMQLSQGPIAPREHEHLRTSDRGVIAVRKALRQAIQDVKDGRDPRGVMRGEAGERVIAVDLEDHLEPVDASLAPA